MKKSIFMIIIVLPFLCILSGCDPILPNENIVAECIPNPLTQGSSANIEIIYPDTEGTAIAKWTDQKVNIISGNDVVEVSDLMIKAVKPGTALLEVSVVANCTYMGIVIDKPIFTTELKVIVE